MSWFSRAVLLANLLFLMACSPSMGSRSVPYGTYLLKVKPAHEMPGPNWLGAAFTNREPCEIWIRHQSELGPYSFDQVLKHEAAHCHGWRH